MGGGVSAGRWCRREIHCALIQPSESGWSFKEPSLLLSMGKRPLPQCRDSGSAWGRSLPGHVQCGACTSPAFSAASLLTQTGQVRGDRRAEQKWGKTGRERGVDGEALFCGSAQATPSKITVIGLSRPTHTMEAYLKETSWAVSPHPHHRMQELPF